MTPLWSVIRTELAREKAVARRIIAQGYLVAELVEVRFIRRSRHAKAKHTQEKNLLPGKVIALVPDISLDEMGDIPHTLGIARDAQGVPWAIPENELNEFVENVKRLNDEALAEYEKKPKRKQKHWENLKEGLQKYLQVT